MIPVKFYFMEKDVRDDLDQSILIYLVDLPRVGERIRWSQGWWTVSTINWMIQMIPERQIEVVCRPYDSYVPSEGRHV